MINRNAKETKKNHIFEYTAPYTAKWQMYSLYITHASSHASCIAIQPIQLFSYTAIQPIQYTSLYNSPQGGD